MQNNKMKHLSPRSPVCGKHATPQRKYLKTRAIHQGTRHSRSAHGAIPLVHLIPINVTAGLLRGTCHHTQVQGASGCVSARRPAAFQFRSLPTSRAPNYESQNVQNLNSCYRSYFCEILSETASIETLSFNQRV